MNTSPGRFSRPHPFQGRGQGFESPPGYRVMCRDIVLGDPGRWICSGMSGGAVYLRRSGARTR